MPGRPTKQKREEREKLPGCDSSCPPFLHSRRPTVLDKHRRGNDHVELVFVWRNYSSKKLVYLLDISRETLVRQSRDLGYTTLVQCGRAMPPYGSAGRTPD